jgi:prophage regulatory protein
MPADGPRFLPLKDVAEELNVGLPVVRSLIRTGELAGIQVGERKIWRVGRADLEDYIARAYKAAAEAISAGTITEDDSE